MDGQKNIKLKPTT